MRWRTNLLMVARATRAGAKVTRGSIVCPCRKIWGSSGGNLGIYTRYGISNHGLIHPLASRDRDRLSYGWRRSSIIRSWAIINNLLEVLWPPVQRRERWPHDFGTARNCWTDGRVSISGELGSIGRSIAPRIGGADFSLLAMQARMTKFVSIVNL